MPTVIDTAAGFPSAAAIKAAGHAGILAYVSPSRPGSNFPGKPITKAIADSYRANGVQVAAVWQYGKPNGSAPSDWTTGYEGGKRMAAEALQRSRAAGMPGYCPIYFAVDENITLAQWNSTAVQFFRGCCDAIGREWVGIYGSSRVCSWAIEDAAVDPRWVWVTRAWSDDDGKGYAALYQRVIDTPSSPGPQIGGVTVDVNDVYAADWGQWSINRAPGTPSAQTGGGMTAPRFAFIPAIGGASSPRTRAPINFLLHTEQGGGQNPAIDAERLGRYCNNTANQVSYHYSLRDGKLVQLVPLNRASWSVLDANGYTINLCFAGSYAEWTRKQWLDYCREDIRIAAYIAVRDCKAHNIPVTVIKPPYRRGAGISDHKYVTQALGIGTHTDVGAGFPWDIFEADVRSFLAPALNLIDAEYARAKGWIGKRIDAAEVPLYKAGKKIGAFIGCEFGHVYWRDGAAAAVAVPHADPEMPGTGLFETWGKDYGYELGPLGFPRLAHAVVTNGAVQSFDGGQLFRKNGSARGWMVHGRILDAYRAMRFEQGALGWPTGDEYAVEGTDNRAQQFEHGQLRWAPSGVVATFNTETSAA